MKIFLAQTNLSGICNGFFEIIADPKITTKKEAFKYLDKFYMPFNIIELDIKSMIGLDIEYPNIKDIKEKYYELEKKYNN